MLTSIKLFSSIIIFYKRYTNRKLVYKKLISKVKYSKYIYYARPYKSIDYNIERRYSLRCSVVDYYLANFLIVNIVFEFKEVIKDIESLEPFINE